MARVKGDIFRWVMLFLSSMILLFIIAPLAGMALKTGRNEFFGTIADSDVRNSVWYTLRISFTATIVFAGGAIPLAWIMARKRFPGRKVIQGIIDLPVVIPHTAAGIALLGLISRDGIAGQAASVLGLNLVNNPAGTALAMAFVSLPFLVNAARDGFASVPEKLEKAALSLGASRSRVFFTISLPLAWRNIVSGLVMMFARGMSEFGAVVIVAYHPMTAPVMIYERFSSFGLSYARPLSLLFVLVALVIFILFRMISLERRVKKTSEADD
ncbi:MAG: ABC transporter permease subunit [Bacteroidetes bacterium]|nr:ABC transporter permease subunit [Bacteroidota bacterium]